MANVLYDISDKRKYYRLTNPVKIKMEGKEYSTLDWSVNALKIADYAGFLEKNDETTAEIEIDLNGVKIKFSQKIRVLRFDAKNGSLVVEYVGILPINRKILTYFSKNLLTDEFQSPGEIINHMETPITHDYIHNTFLEDKNSSILTKRPLKIFSQIVLGIAVILIIFYLTYFNVHLMPVESAVVTSRTETLNSPTQGILSEVFVKEGTNITEGQALFRVVDPEFERKIEDKRIEILKNRALLSEKEKQLANNAQAAKIAFLREELKKKTLLYEKKFVSKPEVDELEGEILELEQKLVVLRAEKERLERIIAINEKDLAFSESINAHNTVKAPFNAVLEDLMVFKGKYVDEKTPLAVIKSNSSDKFIEAHLKVSEPHKLALNSVVYIEIPLYDLKLEGKLADIRKKDGLIAARIKPDDPDLLEGIKQGTPAKISFVKNNFMRSLDFARDDVLKKRLGQILKMPPAPVETLISQGITDKTLPEAAKTQRAFKDAYNSAFLGLCYKLEGNKQCLKEAKTRLLQWAEVNEPTGNPINETQLEGFVFAYNYIKPELARKEKNAMLNWFSRIRDRQLKWKFGPTSGINNWKTHSLKMLLLLDRALGDEEAFKQHLTEAKEHYKANINENNGESFDYKQKGNSLWYHTYNLEPWLEIALMSGEFKDGIKSQFDFFNRHLQAGENTKATRAVYSYYTLFPEEKDTELIRLAGEDTSIKNDFFRLRAGL